MHVSDFDFDLPPAQIAQTACEPRDEARLLVYRRATGARQHARVRDLADVLAPGDLLVVNDTRVLPHRLLGRRNSGARVEVLILERHGSDCRGLLKPAAKLRPGEELALEGGALRLRVGARLPGGGAEFTLSAPLGSLEQVLQRVGRAPLPPYLARGDDDDPAPDRERYQTIFAAHPGAVAAPTAGLHFTESLLRELAARGIERTAITLHVGEGTFAPLRVDQVEQHRMHEERYEVGAPAAEAVAAARRRGARVVAVGTTSARVLETCATAERQVRPGAGSTDLFLFPGRPLRVVDALLTNFHLPRSTLLMLVAALVGRSEVLDLYREAIAEGYRFYSFGDAMLVL